MTAEQTERERGGGFILLLPILGLAASAIIYFVMRSRPATLWGVVTDRDTAQPIEGVKVTLNSRVTYTDPLGYYEMTGLKAESHTLTFEKDGYAPVDGAVVLAPGENEIHIEMEPAGQG